MSRSRITSPSITTRRRKTPCVEGCCGPMLRTYGSLAVVTLVASRGGVPARLRRHLLRDEVGTVERAIGMARILEREAPQPGGQPRRHGGHAEEVLAQRVPGVALPQQQAPQVGV